VLRRFAIDQLAFQVIRSNPRHRAQNESIPRFRAPFRKAHASRSPSENLDVTSTWLSSSDDIRPGVDQWQFSILRIERLSLPGS
jgi:hypothetical protein